MLEQIVGFFVSWFIYPGILWTQVLIGIGLGIAFGAFWLAGYWPPLFKKVGLWVVLASSAILALVTVSFVQIPLQSWTGQALNHFWSQEVLISWLLLAGIPQILLSGLVQEGAKLVPVVVYWLRAGRVIDPKSGLAIGAVAGAGLGVFEAVWAHNTVFAAGWGWETVQNSGLVVLVPFWERFSAVAAHIGFSALAGYGLARGWGWQFYLLAAFLHGLLNYSVILLQKGVFTVIHVEIYATVVALVVTGVALWLRWRRSADVAETY
jgi:RsiW-degrading membrane proteinase PrsW (M82 family)